MEESMNSERGTRKWPARARRWILSRRSVRKRQSGGTGGRAASGTRAL